MLKLGAQNVKGLYLGGQEIKRAYLGEQLVYDAGGLPAGYTALEYIQSSGTQYINTGLKPNGNTGITLLVDILQTNPETVGIFGARDDGLVNTFSLWKISNTAFRMDYGSAPYSIAVNPLGQHTISQSKNQTTIDGAAFQQNAATFQSSTILTVMGINTKGTVDERMVKCKLYSCQIYDNGTPVRDFVPCKNPSGAVGLYDLIGRKFYVNAGTGTFTAGPAV